MYTIARWTAQIVIIAAMTLAPAAIAIGLATSAQAAPVTTNSATSAQHHAFPNQNNTPQPGTSVHHHHQHNRR